MSEKMSLIIGGKGDGPSAGKEPISPNARMQWMADLVCAILSAETDRRPMSSSTVKRAPGT